MNDLMTYGDGIISVWCRECGHYEEIPGTQEVYDAIRRRDKPIQDILPDVRPEIREMFQTGWCDVCFKLNTSLLPDREVDEILRCTIELGLLTEEVREKVMTAAAVYLDPQKFITDLLTELEWHDGSDGLEDLRPQLAKLREKILEIYSRE